MAAERREVAAVLVLGDIGRSPRMQYHAMSLADHGYRVHLVGYGGAKPPDRLVSNPHIRLHNLPTPWKLPESSARALFLAYAPFKVLYQVLVLVWTLLFVLPRPSVLLVQNPPAIPTLAVARLICALRRSRLVVDWHNYGYTILALRLGFGHLAVRLAQRYERWFGRRAAAHLCVTRAMARDLRNEWHVAPAPVVLYDVAPSHFHRLTRAERNEFFDRADIQALFQAVPGGADAVSSTGGDGAPTRRARAAALNGKGKGKVRATESDGEAAAAAGPSPLVAGVPARTSPRLAARRHAPFDRVALIVSSTSWTEDEDFGMLMEAAATYNEHATRASAHLCIVVTGKGPLREQYEAEFAQLDLPYVTFVTAWLAAEDYPRLLGVADLGICLHTSSSGLDLPMKVVDMFGCGLPVCAVDYSCIGELVQDGVNGRLFSSGDSLATILLHLFGGGRASAGAAELAQMQDTILAARRDTWEANWQRTVLPVLRPA